MNVYINHKLGRYSRRSWLQGLGFNAAVIAVIVGAMVPMGILHKAKAEADVTAPTLVSASIASGDTLDTENTMYPGYNVSYVNLQVNDDLSGNVAPVIIYTSPSGKQTATGASNGIDGNQNWSTIVSFPQYSESGVWKATLYLEDYSGNKITYSNDLLHTLGDTIDITLTGQGDTTDPTLTSVVRTNPGSLNVTAGPQAAYFDVAVADNLSGFGIPTLNYTSPSGNITTESSSCTPDQSNTTTTGLFNCLVAFSQYTEAGSWSPDLVFSDSVGDTVHYTAANLLSHGINLPVIITGTTDSQAPVVSNAHITFANPPADDIPFGGAVLTVTGNLSDNLSGLNGTSYVAYTSPSGNVVYGSLMTDGSGTFTSNVALPVYSEGGNWQPSIFVEDVAGNKKTYTDSDFVAMGSSLAVTVGKNITETAAAGGTVTSDYEHDGATAANPVEASVTTPTGGPVSIVIVQASNVTDGTNGYTFFDRQISINAPVESASNPLTLDFQIDASMVPSGQSASSLQITRNGVVVPACSDQTTANPDPCVFSRLDLAGGDVEVKIHSTTASAWASGFPTKTYKWDGFESVDGVPDVNKAQAGQTIPIKFEVEGVKHNVSNILAAGQPQTQKASCTAQTPIGSAEAALSGNNQGLTRVGSSDHFNYLWRTDKTWKGTCRLLSVGLDDGSTHKAFFKF